MEANRQKSDIIGPNLFNRKRIIILNSEKKNLKLTSAEFLFHSERFCRGITQTSSILEGWKFNLIVKGSDSVGQSTIRVMFVFWLQRADLPKKGRPVKV